MLLEGGIAGTRLIVSRISSRTASGPSSARPVQIRFERRLGSATALSLQRPSPFCHPERRRADLRCAIRVPRSYRPTTPPIITETPTSPLSFRFSGVVRGTADPSAALPRISFGGVSDRHAPFLARKAHSQPFPAQCVGNPGRMVAEPRHLQTKFGQLLSSAVQSAFV
jgi:hypothetical protein